MVSKFDRFFYASGCGFFGAIFMAFITIGAVCYSNINDWMPDWLSYGLVIIATIFSIWFGIYLGLALNDEVKRTGYI